MLGNDVIDLAEARSLGKESDGRFLARVFTEEEHACITRAKDPALALWMIWAAKESLFKIESRRDPSAIFAHRSFPVPGLGGIANAIGGSLRFEHGFLRFEWEWDAERLHCVVGSVAWEGGAELGECARTVALRLLKVPGAEIRREPGPVRPLAPVACVRGQVLPVIVSLSHDGRFAAAVISKKC